MRCPVCHRRLLPGSPCPLHGRHAPAPFGLDPEEQRPPPVVPGHLLTAELGRGGFAWVFAARTAAGAEVAIKLARSPGDPRFAREAEALRRVGPPAVPALLGTGEVEGRPYLVLERLHGPTLAAWLAALPGDGVPPLAEALPLFSALCDAVARVHDAGLVHRDLKPENVLLREGGAPALLDLGLARGEPMAEAPELTRTGQRLGTAHSMSPEQCAGRTADARADVYALGVILFELLTGRPPFVGDEAEVLRGHASLRPPRPSALRPDAAPLDAAVLRCLEKEPERRFPDAGALRDALRERSGAPAGEEAARAPAAASPSQRRQVPLLGVATRALLPELSAAVELEGGVIARVQSGLYVVAFPEHASPVAGLRAAVRAASRWGRDRRVIHLAELRVRPGQVGTRLAGAALDRAEWWHEAPPEPLAWLTRDAAALLEGLSAEPGPSGYTALRESAVAVTRDEGAAPPPLVGRDGLLAELEADARLALRLGEPALAVLVSEAGLGKTRVLEALAAALAGPAGPRVVTLRAASPLSGAQGGLGAELLPLAGASPADALASTRGMAPEAGRHTLARLVGEGLRRSAAARPLVLLVDDAQWADAVALDAVELATLAGARAPLWILLAGRPELRELRPALGERAARCLAPALPPLPPPAARQLLLELLRPLEYVPHAALERLEALAGGVPQSLVELVRALRDSGAVRREASGEWTLAPDELLDVPAARVFPWLGERALEALPANMRGLAELCAVLGDGATREEVAAAQARLGLEPDLAPLASVDAGVGLARLVRARLLATGPGGRHDFRHPLLREALEASIPPRRRRLLHLAALGALPEGAGPGRAWRRARHAAGAGEGNAAFDAWLAMAEEARLAHRVVEAELAYSAALEQLPPDDARREQALAGRGMVRYRSHRFREAREDLHRAAEQALARGDAHAAADLLLEEATALDWMEDWDGSRALTERALELGQGATGPRLGVRLELGRGRLAVRGGQWDEAVLRLRRSAEDAARVEEPEVRAVSLVLLGAVLTLTDRLEEAEATFEAALAHCAATGDRLHLAMAYNNRGLLWQKRQAVERAIEDLRLNGAIARELGHAQIERWSTFNLGEFLHFLGRWDEAWTLALRAHELGLRFFGEHPVAQDALLLARIAAARGELAEAGARLAWIDERCGQALPPSSGVQRRMVRQVIAEAAAPFSPEAWDAVVEDARRECSPDELLEVLVQAAGQAVGAGAPAGRYVEEASALAERSPLWWPRLRALGKGG